MKFKVPGFPNLWRASAWVSEGFSRTRPPGRGHGRGLEEVSLWHGACGEKTGRRCSCVGSHGGRGAKATLRK